MRLRRDITSALLPLVLLAAARAEPIPVLFDTDIGTDIDDVYALAQILHSPELKLLGVTTVAGDTVARARLAAKLLSVAGWPEIPVYAGLTQGPQAAGHTDWAKAFSSSTMHPDGGVEFLRQQINARPGEITIIAVGEMTNVAALLASETGIASKIKAIALMGGAIKRGYASGSKPEPEWNLRCNVAASHAVFTSGVPLLVAPLDSTADLILTEERCMRIFAHGTPLNDALASLDFIWRRTNTWKADKPTLFDSLAVALVATPGIAPLTPLHLAVEPDGLTRVIADRPTNALVALTADPAAFLDYFTARLNR